jgi:hypothetical protein
VKRAETALATSISQLHQAQAISGSLKSGATVRSSVRCVESAAITLAQNALSDADLGKRHKSYRGQVELSRVATLSFVQGAWDFLLLEKVDTSPSTIRSARGLLEKVSDDVSALFADYGAGFPIPGVITQVDPSEGAWLGGFERWAMRNDALGKAIYFILGIVVALATKALIH